MNSLAKKSVLMLIVGMVFFGATMIVGKTTALSEEELLEYSLNDIMFYQQCGTGDSSSNECGITVAGSTIEEKIWSGLTSFLTEEQAAGAMGSMVNESGFSPAKHEYGFPEKYPDFDLTAHDDISYGIGLMQWSGGRRIKLGNFLKEKALDLWTKYIDEGRTEYRKYSGSEFLAKAGDADTNTLIALELCYMKQESETNPRYANFLKASSVGDASDAFVKDVESPRNIPGEQDARRPKAQAYYDQFHGKTISGGSDSSSGSGGSTDPSCNSCAQGSMNINGTAVCLAWPLGTEDSLWDYANHNKTSKPSDAFKKAHDEVTKGSSDKCAKDGASCDMFVATVVRWAGIDKDYKLGNVSDQLNYVNSHPDLWEVRDFTSNDQLKAGDIIIEGCGEKGCAHTWIVVQDEKGDFYNASASYCDRYAQVTDFYTPKSRAYVIRSKDAKNSNTGVSVKNGVKTSSMTGTISSGTGMGNGDINASAIELAWPKGKGNPSRESTDRFKEVFNSLKGGPGSSCWKNGKSCTVFVNTVLLYSGARTDGAEKVADEANIIAYMVEHPDEWEDVTANIDNPKYSDLQPGDILAYYRTSSEGQKPTKYKYKGASHMEHIAIYIENENGGGIAEAAFCKYFGKVRKVSASRHVGNLVRVFRWKNQQGGSNCNVCDDGSGDGQLKAGGFETVEEATAFMQSYVDAASPGGKYYNKSGDVLFGVKNGFVNDGGCPYGVLNNCVAFSQWFINNYTTLGPNWKKTGSGIKVVDNLVSAGLERGTGENPQPYAIFSNKGVSPDGHTGVILGVNTATRKVIVGEANCNESKKWPFTPPTAKEYSFDDIKDWWYAYTDKVRSMGGPLKDA